MNRKMLLVEDDKDLAKMYATKFSMEGWSVDLSNDGAEAITIARDNNYDAILLDLMLPGISGIDVLEILRSDPKTVKTPIIVYTNFGDNFNREKCLTYGADDFILKVDSTPEGLCATLKNIMILKSEEVA